MKIWNVIIRFFKALTKTVSTIIYFFGRHTLIILSENKYIRFQRKKRDEREGY